MDEEKKIPAAEQSGAATQEERKESAAEQLRRAREASEAEAKAAMDVMKEGRGVLTLETPIMAGDTEITELAYNFNALTGLDYTDAMDADSRGSAQKLYSITYRQALNLFAIAAAKEVERLDMTDIITKMGITDASEAVQLATLFFTASIRAGRKRISRRQ